MKKQSILTAAAIIFLCTACGIKEEVTETVQETAMEVTQETAQEDIPIEENTEPEAEEPEEPEEELFEEDTNVYGNTMGNLNNQGFFVKYGDNGYVERNLFGQTYLIDNDGNAVYIKGTDIYSLNYYDGQIYAIWNDEDQERNKSIVTGSMESENFYVDTGRKAESLYVVNGIVYYRESMTNKLYCYDPSEESAEDTLLVDSDIYYPVIYKDRIIYQNDADEESLYSIALDGGESAKLNDIHSHWPIAYKDKIFYQGIINDAYTLRCMNLDGSEDMEIAKIKYSYPVLCENRLCLIDEENQGVVSYLNLDNPEDGFQVIDVGDELIEEYAADENAFIDIDITQYKLSTIDHVASIDNKILFWAYFNNEADSWLVDAVEYDFVSEKAASLPFYDARERKDNADIEEEMAVEITGIDMPLQETTTQSEQEIAQQTEQQVAQQPAVNTSAHDYYRNCTQEQADQADAIAKQIADSIMSNAAYTTDLQRVTAAAQTVKSYCDSCVYGSDDNKYYRSPYGVFVAGVYTCAGSTRALGRVLDYMGYSWQHTNESKWVHQWCVLTMDGQIGFADGMGGFAGYGEMVNGMTLADGRTIYFPTE